MEVETLEIRSHLSRFPPFDGLSEDLLDQVAGGVEIAYFKAGTDILTFDEPIEALLYVRSGAVEVFRRNGELYNRLGEGDILGHFGLLRNRRVSFPARALEDTLIYFIPAEVFDELCRQDDHFADFVELERPRLESAVEQQRKNNDLLITRIRKLVTQPPVMVPEEESVQQAALDIGGYQASAVLVLEHPDQASRNSFTDDRGELRNLVGILTDSDFRTRVVAEGLPPGTPVREVMRRNVITIQSDESVYDAMLCMLRNNIHHLPVLQRRRPIGIVHLSDIIRYETHSSLYLVNNIFNQSDVQGLAQLAPDVRSTFVRMVEEGADSLMIGGAMSTIGRAFIRRLLELAEDELGPPPVPYCYMVLGSMARNEQSIVTDQDNALVLDDAYDPAKHDEYFLALANRVSDGLDACGYPYCKGDIMATNPQWRQPLSAWKEYFNRWIDDPSPERLLHSSIFFDLDSVAGEESMVEELQQLVAERARNSPRFLASMARNALSRTPPLGFFRTFVVETDGRQNKSFNIKRRGTAPMSDLIRVHALACGSRSQNSFARLDDIAQTKLLATGVGDRIRYAMEFMSMARIYHQAMQLRHDQEPDNNIAPESVSDHERHNLKEAFQVLSHAQKFLRFRYPMPGRGH
jgi:CBS domain-containing protein